MTLNDELKIYRGEDYIISDYIRIKQPTLGEICDYGEADYFSLVYNFVATPQSMKAQLWEMGIDYTEIEPWKLFYSVLYRLFPQEKTAILFGDLDFAKFLPMQKQEDDSIFLFQTVNDTPVVLDEYTYKVIVNYLCSVHFIEQDLQMPANESTKMILIEDAQMELAKSQNKERRSYLKNLISTMVNIEGFKYNHAQVWDMKINAFMDSVRRISKIKNANLLLQSGYSGFGINLKDINKKELDWIGELN